MDQHPRFERTTPLQSAWSMDNGWVWAIYLFLRAALSNAHCISSFLQHGWSKCHSHVHTFVCNLSFITEEIFVQSVVPITCISDNHAGFFPGRTFWEEVLGRSVVYHRRVVTYHTISIGAHQSQCTLYYYIIILLYYYFIIRQDKDRVQDRTRFNG